MFSLSLFLLVTLVAPSFAVAQSDSGGAPSDGPADVESLTVVGSRTPQPLELMPGSVDVITREEIEASKYDGVVDILRHLPGIHIEQAGTRGSLASIFTRGLDPNHTLILLDGIVLNDPTNARGGSFDLSTLDVIEIERVELVRGPVSAVHGSDAVAGAINIRTRGGAGPDEVKVDVAGGRFGYGRAMASARGHRGPLDLSLAGSWVREGVPEDLGGYEGGNVVATAGIVPSVDADLRGTLRYSDSRSRAYPAFSGGPDYAELQGEFELRDVSELDVGLTYEQQIHDGLSAALWATTSQRWEELSSPGVPPEVPAEPGTSTRLERYSIAGRVTAEFAKRLALTVGGDAYWEEGSSRGDLDFSGVIVPGAIDFDLHRFVGASFAEAHWTPDFGLALQVGVRVDLPDGFAPEVTPRLSGAWELLDTGLSLTGSWGEGFKLPSFYALGNPIAGNPDLVPERSRGWDLGIGYAFRDELLRTTLIYFDLNVENLIDFDSGSFSLQNLAQVKSQGVELQIAWRPLEELEVTAHATWNEVAEVTAGVQLLNRPRWRGGLGVLWRPVESVQARLQALFVGPLAAESIPTGVVILGGYQRLDLAVSWWPTAWLEVYLALDNMLDQRYQEAVGIPAPGVRPRGGIQVRL